MLYKHSLTYDPRQWLVLLPLVYSEGTEVEVNCLTEGHRDKRQVIEHQGPTIPGDAFYMCAGPHWLSPPPAPQCKHRGSGWSRHLVYKQARAQTSALSSAAQTLCRYWPFGLLGPQSINSRSSCSFPTSLGVPETPGEGQLQ